MIVSGHKGMKEQAQVGRNGERQSSMFQQSFDFMSLGKTKRLQLLEN